MEAALQSLGLREIFEIPEGLFVEGGDIIPYCREGSRTLFIGYGPRTSFDSLEFLADVMIPVYADEIIGVELSDWRMNLDGGFMPVAEDVLLANRQSILGADYINSKEKFRFDLWSMIEDLGIHVIDTNREESIYQQSCNCVCVGDRKVVCYDLCDRVDELLRQREIQTF